MEQSTRNPSQKKNPDVGKKITIGYTVYDQAIETGRSLSLSVGLDE